MSKNKFVNVFNFYMIVIILKLNKINDNKILVKHSVFLTRSFSVNKKSSLVVSKLVSKLFSSMSLFCFEYNVILFESLFVCIQVDVSFKNQ